MNFEQLWKSRKCPECGAELADNGEKGLFRSLMCVEGDFGVDADSEAEEFDDPDWYGTAYDNPRVNPPTPYDEEVDR